MGPGRWGSVNIDLGVHVTYGDIFNTRVLVEMSMAHDGHTPNYRTAPTSSRTLVEAGIHSLALHLGGDAHEANFKWEFFNTSANSLSELLPEDAVLSPYLKVIDLDRLPGSPRLKVLMNGAREEAVGFLA